MFSKANPEQKKVIQYVTNKIDNEYGKRLVLLKAAAGTGKTYFLNAIIKYCYSKFGTNISCIVVSTTAISAQLLENGNTSHSIFKLPLDVFQNNAVSGLAFNSDMTKQMESAKVLIWDEIFAIWWDLIEVVNKFLKALFNTVQPFGNLTCVFSGDVRQTLPKLKRASRETIVNLCISRSNLYSLFRVFSLSTNMRLRGINNPNAVKFAKFILDVGDGTYPIDSVNQIELPNFIDVTNTLNNVVENVYSNNINLLQPSQLSLRGILAPLNKDVWALNKQILELLNGSKREYLSYDEEIDEVGETVYDLPDDVLHEFTRRGLPLHKLELKKNCVVMCLRNLSRNVCNGTKLSVKKLHENIIDCEILTGPGKGLDISIPRITLKSDAKDEAIIIKRRQFPLALAYAMTIDKSQGQSLEHVGLILNSQCFSHGQLYTALSRPTISENLIVYLPLMSEPEEVNRFCENVVWKEVFQS